MTALRAAIPLAAVAAAALAGCVERRIHITSDPSGALVRLNDVEVGRTPLEVDFTWYGVYDVRLSRDGCLPLLTSAEAKAPWWETPGLDLVAEATPGRKVVDIRWHFELEPAPADADGVAPRDPLIERAREMRDRALAPQTPGSE